jgi:peptidyl-prolyl cis-trans isomerase C
LTVLDLPRTLMSGSSLSIQELRVKRVLPFLVALCLAAACSKGTTAAASTKPAASPSAAPAAASASGQSAAAPGQQAAPAVKPVPAQLPDVLAKVNGESITKADFEKAIQNVEQRAGGPVPADQRDRIYRGVLDQMVGYKLLTQETKARKVAVPDADVDARVGQLRQQFPNEDAFKQVLAQQHMTVEQLKADARQDMAVEKLIEDAIAAKVAVKPEDVEAFYKANQEHFQQPERVRASHILIQVPKEADAATKAKARAKAEDLLKQARAGKDFAELARQNSQDPGSAANGGDLGFFAKGQMVGPFNDVAFSQKPGTISDIVETDFGFHIIKVVEKQPAGVVKLQEAKPQIQQYLENQARQQQTQAFVESLRTKSKVEIFI